MRPLKRPRRRRPPDRQLRPQLISKLSQRDNELLEHAQCFVVAAGRQHSVHLGVRQMAECWRHIVTLDSLDIRVAKQRIGCQADGLHGKSPRGSDNVIDLIHAASLTGVPVVMPIERIVGRSRDPSRDRPLDLRACRGLGGSRQ